MARDRTSLGAFTSYFGGKRGTEATPASIEAYRTWRYATISRLGRPMSPASINRELACLKRMSAVAVKGLIVHKGGMPATNTASAVSLERECNERDRVLSADEFERVYTMAATWLKADDAAGLPHRDAVGRNPGAPLGSSRSPARGYSLEVGRDKD